MYHNYNLLSVLTSWYLRIHVVLFLRWSVTQAFSQSSTENEVTMVKLLRLIVVYGIR